MIAMRILRVLLLPLVFVLSIALGAQTRTVALTFDDLPLASAGSEGITPAERIAEARSVNHAILAALKRHHAPAIAFVNEGKVVADDATEEYRKILSPWIEKGNQLGNHTFSHPDLNKISSAEFEEDVLKGEASIQPLMAAAGSPLRYLRFPFNHTGENTEKQHAVADFLKQRGYEVATCTIDNSDWVFAQAYRAILRKNDTRAAQELRSAYLAYTEKEIEYYSKLHRQVLGHEIPHVMLLHASRLNADTMDEILKLFERMSYRFVTLTQAQSDPAYRTPITFATTAGPMWGYRWAKELNIAVDGKLEPEVPAWIEHYGH